MQSTLRVSTGVKLLVWKEADAYLVRPAESCDEPQTCLAIDLFEVIAELGGLDLEDGAHAVEAITLAERAMRALGDTDDAWEIDGSMQRFGEHDDLV